MLRYYEKLSYNEIAEVLSIPLGTVKSRISAAISALHDDYAGTEEDIHREL